MATRDPIARLALSVVLIFTACDGEPPPPETGFRVRLLTSATLSGRWEREAERGLGLISAQLDADIARTRAAGGSDQRRHLHRHAEEGIDLIFCVGPEAEPMVYTEAAAFPDTAFVVLPGKIHGANVGSVAFMPEEVGYLAGAAAAELSAAARVGILRGSGRDWLEQLETGFSAGLTEARSDAELVFARGPEGPWELTARGVDLALLAADEIDPPVLAAIHDAGLEVIATDPAMITAEPELVVGAVQVDVAEAMLRIAREVCDHRFTGQVFAFDLGSGVLDMVLNPDLDRTQRGPATREIVERTRSEITAGWVEIEELGIGQ